VNTRFLRSFCVVAERGSLAAAARQLGLANASLAEQIRALEQELGAKLIARHGQGVILTAAGQAVLETARAIVAQTDTLHHLAQRGQPSGRLRVGAISTALMAMLPAALQQLAARYPAVELTVVPGTSVGLLRMLEMGEIDCALTVRPPFALPKSLVWLGLRDEPLVLVAPPDRAGDNVDTLIAAGPLIRMDRKAWTGLIVDRFLADHGLAPRDLFELDAPEAIVVLVSQGMGLSLLPDWGIAPPHGRDLRIIPIDDKRYSRAVGLLSRPGPASALVDAFSQAVAASLDGKALHPISTDALRPS
jgi:DNA-binding transcriptional LysR family regulator